MTFPFKRYGFSSFFVGRFNVVRFWLWWCWCLWILWMYLWPWIQIGTLIHLYIYILIFTPLVLDEDRYLFLVDSAKVYFNGLSVAGPGVVWKLSRWQPGVVRTVLTQDEGAQGLWFAGKLRCCHQKLKSMLLPGTQMTFVLVGKDLVLRGWPSKIEDKQVPGGCWFGE